MGNNIKKKLFLDSSVWLCGVLRESERHANVQLKLYLMLKSTIISLLILNMHLYIWPGKSSLCHFWPPVGKKLH